MSDDPFALSRFVEAQREIYPVALEEVRRGRKRTHWMWFVFPQLAGLGSSVMSMRYAISGLDEARAYLEHPVLGVRLRECCEAVLAVEGKTVFEIFGSPDDQKLRSCATLFELVAPAGAVFGSLLEKYHAGERDRRTLALLGRSSD